MDLGLFMMPLHPPEKDRTQSFEEDSACIILCDRLGYKEAWIGQHHSAEWEPIPSNDIFIATMIPQTENIRLGTGVSILPQHHPANVAIRLAYLDHLSRGRINVGFGQGGIPTDWALFDLPDPGTQGLMTLEAMDIILKLWQSQEAFDFKGEHWRVKYGDTYPDLALGPLLRPYQNPHPPVAMSIVKETSMAAKTAGERGFIPISINLAPPHKVKMQWDTYCEGADSAGRIADRSQWRVSRSIYVDETDKAARAHARDGVFSRCLLYHRGLLEMSHRLDLVKIDPDMADSDITADYLLDNIGIVGSVDTVTERLQELIDVTGGFGTLLNIAQDWDDKDRMQRSMQLLAEEVLPRLQ